MLSAGADVVKIFPSALLGDKVISELTGPFPDLKVMPSGGINLDNLADWQASGAFALGVGGSLVGPGKHGDYANVTKNSKRFIRKLKNVNNKTAVATSKT